MDNETRLELYQIKQELLWQSIKADMTPEPVESPVWMVLAVPTWTLIAVLAWIAMNGGIK